MTKTKVKVVSKSGLHARPADTLTRLASKFQSKVELICDETRIVNAKSILSVLAAGIDCGMEVELVCDGEDEKEACRELAEAIEAGLGE